MLQFLPMLQQGVGQVAGGAAASQGGGGIGSFFKALGADKMGQPASVGQGKIGMQYANMGMTPPQVPNMMNMVGSMNNMNQQQPNQHQAAVGQINPLLQMLMNGGR